MKKITLSALLLFVSTNVFAQSNESIMNMYTRGQLPDDIKTVEQAFNYIIEPSGYRLVKNTGIASAISRSKVEDPRHNSTPRPMIEVLLNLVKDRVIIIVDEPNKLVSFRYKELSQ